MADPSEVGKKVLAALAEGRAEAHRLARQDARYLRVLVVEFTEADLDAGRPAWGRSGRIARKVRLTGQDVSDRHVRRILDTLSSVSDSS